MIHRFGVVGNKKRTLTNSDNLVYAGIMAGENVISAHYIFATLKHQKSKHKTEVLYPFRMLSS